jgi:hypothetical protein
MYVFKSTNQNMKTPLSIDNEYTLNLSCSLRQLQTCEKFPDLTQQTTQTSINKLSIKCEDKAYLHSFHIK